MKVSDIFENLYEDDDKEFSYIEVAKEYFNNRMADFENIGIPFDADDVYLQFTLDVDGEILKQQVSKELRRMRELENGFRTNKYGLGFDIADKLEDTAAKVVLAAERGTLSSEEYIKYIISTVNAIDKYKVSFDTFYDKIKPQIVKSFSGKSDPYSDAGHKRSDF